MELINIESEPILSTGMIAVYWNSNGDEILQTNSNFKNSEWYNYSEKRWANARTQDGSYWVWIPRFEYKINSATQTTDVKFIPATQVQADTEYIIHPAFRDGTSNDFENGEWDKEIPGMWVAKFEAGYAMDKNGDGTSDIIGGNLVRPVASSVKYTAKTIWAAAIEKGGTTGYLTARNWLDGIYASDENTWLDGQETFIKYPVFQGKTISMNYITLNDAYNISKALTENGNIYGINTNVDSHLMKNSEWGAVAYLSKSQYGLEGTNIYVNNVNLNSGGTNISNNLSSAYGVTGYAGTSADAATVVISAITDTNAWNTEEGQKASSTGNITGIYDLSGGMLERTTAYVANGHSDLKNFGASIAYNGDTLKTVSTKYITVYPHDSAVDNISNAGLSDITSASIANYTLNTSIYGDAVRETSTSGTGIAGWNNDSSDFVGLRYPFFARGGCYSNNSIAGVTAFLPYNGPAYSSCGFRPVLIVK